MDHQYLPIFTPRGSNIQRTFRLALHPQRLMIFRFHLLCVKGRHAPAHAACYAIRHPEYEIILILESSGQRFVGDSITDFSAVDLYMFGSNLPHKFFSKGLSHKEAVSQIVIQFHENFLGMGFFDRKSFGR